MAGSSSRPADPSGTSNTEDSRWSRWGKTAFDKSIVVSDWASGYANAASAKMGGERFWPKSNDFPEEIAKCERILRAFTVEGIEAKPPPSSSSSSTSSNADPDADIIVEQDPKKDGFVHKKRKVLRKIPPSVIKRAKGIVIYTAMRSGIAPFGGAGGAGLMLARLPDGSWSAPSSISPNNLAVGLLLGFDIFDVVLVVNSELAMQSFKSHKVTLGAETAVAAGPFGTGISGEMGIDRSPVFSYVRSRGLYGGVEAMAQAFLHRFDENERIYYWPGITATDIFEGKVRKPPLVDPLYRALRDAETGVAQGDSLERTVYETVLAPPNKAVKTLAREETAELLEDGERLKLPPTPEELDAMEEAGIPDEYDLLMEKQAQEEARVKAEQEKREIMALPPPPRHKKVVGRMQARAGTEGGKRRVAPPLGDAKLTRRVAPAQFEDESQKETGAEEVVKQEEEHLDLVDLDGPAKPVLPTRPGADSAADDLADELEKSGLDGAIQEAKELNAHAVPEPTPPLIDENAEQIDRFDRPAVVEAHPGGLDGKISSLAVTSADTEPSRPATPKSAIPADVAASDSISRSSSLSRPSRPPRRTAAPTPPVAGTPSTSSASSASAPLRLFFDWDETITAHDTLSLIAPPENTQLHGDSFSSYTSAYLSDLSAFETSFGPRETWASQLEFLAAIDSVERASVARVEEGELFKGMLREELLERVQQVSFRDGWTAFYAWLTHQVESGAVVADVISVGWSGDFIRHAIEQHSPLASQKTISTIYANEIEFLDHTATGKLTKDSPSTAVRTGIDKLHIMQSAAPHALTVYVGDSSTDLPCLVNANFGLLIKPLPEFDHSSISDVIHKTSPPVRFYRSHSEFVDASPESQHGQGVLVRVDDWTQVLEVVQHIQKHCITA